MKKNLKNLKSKTNINIEKKVYYNHICLFSYIHFYLIEKNYIKVYLISTSFFCFVLTSIILGNINNHLPILQIDIISIKKIFRVIKINFKKYDLEHSFLTEPFYRKWIFFTYSYKKVFFCFLKLIDSKFNRLNKISSEYFKLCISNTKQFNTTLRHFFELAPKKWTNNFEIFKKLILKVHLFIFEYIRVDSSVIYHNLSDKRKFLIPINFKNKIKKNFLIIKILFPCIFFDSIQVRLFASI
jgi:hypothetical protein